MNCPNTRYNWLPSELFLHKLHEFFFYYIKDNRIDSSQETTGYQSYMRGFVRKQGWLSQMARAK